MCFLLLFFFKHRIILLELTNLAILVFFLHLEPVCVIIILMDICLGMNTVL